MFRRLLLGFALVMALAALVFAFMGNVLLMVLSLVVCFIDVVLWMEK